MSGAEPSPDLSFLIELVRATGEDLLGWYRRAPADLEVEFKGPRDLVTRVDLAAETRIVDSLRSRHPGDEILSEESGGRLAGDGRVWIIDPLDGTTNFTHGHPFFAISVALWENGLARLAVTHAPALRETYWAERGAGAHRDGQRLRVSDVTDLSRALLATGFSYGRKELDGGALDVFGRLLREAREIRRGGSACLDLAHCASGVFAGFWEYHLKPHDVAAGALLVEEAGGVVTDCRGEGDYLDGGSIVAGAAPIHACLLERLQDGPPHPG